MVKVLSIEWQCYLQCVAHLALMKDIMEHPQCKNASTANCIQRSRR